MDGFFVNLGFAFGFNLLFTITVLVSIAFASFPIIVSWKSWLPFFPMGIGLIHLIWCYITTFSDGSFGPKTLVITIVYSVVILGIGVLVVFKQSVNSLEKARNGNKAVKPNRPSNTIRYCKVCGSVIDNTTKKCLSCGKSYFNWKVARPYILVPLIVIILLGCFLGQAYNYWGIDNDIQYWKFASQQRDRQISGLNSQIAAANGKSKGITFEEYIGMKNK